MAREKKSKWLTDEEVEALFSTVDETGHSNTAVAEKERRRRRRRGVGLEVDPLSGKDPSGSNVGTVIARTAVVFVMVILVAIVGAQIGYGVMRRSSTANLTASVTPQSVASALKGGVEWGDGFTQFPEDFSVQEADEATGRVEVTVVDVTSTSEMGAMSSGYIQATAFATNALLNPNINTVIYHIDVHDAGDGKIDNAQLFGFLQPTTPEKNFMTFIFTKATSKSGGFNIFCTITGIDGPTMERLREKISSSPLDFLGAEVSDDQDSSNKGDAADGTSSDSTSGATGDSTAASVTPAAGSQPAA
ncbi:hypothetical protein AAK967_08260 [Atopobiaceae bacterium 24-176]